MFAISNFQLLPFFFFELQKKKQNQTNTHKKTATAAKEGWSKGRKKDHCDVGLWRQALIAFQQGELLFFFGGGGGLLLRKKQYFSVAWWLCSTYINASYLGGYMHIAVTLPARLFFFFPPLPLFLSLFLFFYMRYNRNTNRIKREEKKEKKRFVVCCFVQGLW